jgi:hypothetical protein
MKKEIWKVIPNTDNKYEVSNFGNVRNIKTKKIRKPVMIGNIVKNRYPAVRIPINKKWKTQLIHRLVATSFLIKPYGKNQVNHINGNKLDSSLKNLEWCNQQENSSHAWSIGLYNHIGINNNKSKLSESDVFKIRNRYACGISIVELSNIFGVSTTNISAIIKNKIWKHII